LCSYNTQQCDAPPRAPLGEVYNSTTRTSWLDFGERKGREKGREREGKEMAREKETERKSTDVKKKFK